MKNFIDKNVIFWDFDGVIIDSEKVRTYGFEKVLEDYPKDQVQQLVKYHHQNGGISRYVKFRYFFEEIRHEEVSDERVEELASRFSDIMVKKLVDKKVLIPETLQFIQKNKDNYRMLIVSGSDGEELRFLCKELEIAHLFEEIEGSPTPKPQLVKQLLEKKKIEPSESVLIGDSVNDYEAAEKNNVQFFGFNNPALKEKDLNYIESFE
ncbi:haloacid dehalogenase [Christiangramia fulva]|uniref:phosphoglycolate phosphatase n=1 Tax=Christiangramia fulva TaxID=2126553 RepID=A0A2R3Z9D4_9FLAO|nr:HAD family hydrolase [Christiangramia fulva]AVR46889.1 haloacid dehalogenase [Christiangramia fulva]